MSRLGYVGSLVVGKLSSRWICGQAVGSASLLHRIHEGLISSALVQSNFARGVGEFGFPGSLGESVQYVTMGAFCVLPVGIMYFKGDEVERTAHKPIHQEALWEETMKEKIMKRRFEKWMIKYGRTYKDKQEKATRYELFKRSVQRVDWNNATRGVGCIFETNDYADRTRQELKSYGGWRDP